MQIYVCTTCSDKRAGPGDRAGARLCADLAAATRDPGVEVVPTECLSVCRRACTFGYAAEGKWTYIFVTTSDVDPATILEGARLYAETPTGVIPWGLRPSILKTGVVARVPPRPGRS